MWDQQSSSAQASAERTAACLPKGFRERTAWGRFYFSDLNQLTPPANLHLLFCGQVNLQVSLSDLEQSSWQPGVDLFRLLSQPGF